MLQTSPRGWPTTKQAPGADQTSGDRPPAAWSNQVPSRSPWTPTAAVAHAFYLIWESLAWTLALAIKPFPTPHTSQTACSPAPGSSARERPPNKGLHQRSIEVALSSRGVSYNYDFRSSKLKFQPPETLAQAPLFHTELAHR